MKTFRVTYIGKTNGVPGTISYVVKGDTPQDAVRNASNFQRVECPGYRMKGVSEVKDSNGVAG